GSSGLVQTARDPQPLQLLEATYDHLEDCLGSILRQSQFPAGNPGPIWGKGVSEPAGRHERFLTVTSSHPPRFGLAPSPLSTDVNWMDSIVAMNDSFVRESSTKIGDPVSSRDSRAWIRSNANPSYPAFAPKRPDS